MLLLDTCAFLWLVVEPKRLSRRAREALDVEAAALHLSDASIWEACMKWRAGKLVLTAPPRSFFAEQMDRWKVERVPIEAEHVYRATELPDVHRDPFDRLLIAQAIQKGLRIVTPDPSIRAYPVATVW